MKTVKFIGGPHDGLSVYVEHDDVIAVVYVTQCGVSTGEYREGASEGDYDWYPRLLGRRETTLAEAGIALARCDKAFDSQIMDQLTHKIDEALAVYEKEIMTT